MLYEWEVKATEVAKKESVLILVLLENALWETAQWLK